MADAYHVGAKNVEALRFLYVANRSKKMREQTLERVQESVEAWLDGYGSPPMGAAAAGILNGLDRRAFIQELVPDLLRLSISCPFDDVRDKCKEILADIKVRFLNKPDKFPVLVFSIITTFSSTFCPLTRCIYCDSPSGSNVFPVSD